MKFIKYWIILSMLCIFLSIPSVFTILSSADQPENCEPGHYIYCKDRFLSSQFFKDLNGPIISWIKGLSIYTEKHIAMYEKMDGGIHYFIHSTFPAGVHRSSAFLMGINYDVLDYYYVINASSDDREFAVEWAEIAEVEKLDYQTELGEYTVLMVNYDIWDAPWYLPIGPDWNAHRVQCAELVWAGYMKNGNGINICPDTTLVDEARSDSWYEKVWYGTVIDRARTPNPEVDPFTPLDPPISESHVVGYVDASFPADDPDNNQWTTIQKGIDGLSSFDTLIIKSGTYNEDIVIDKSLVIEGEDRESTILEGSITMSCILDYELPRNRDNDWLKFLNMTGNEVLMHFNNDSSVGEDYLNLTNVYEYAKKGYNGTYNGVTWNTSTPKGIGSFDFDGNNDYINMSCIPAFAGENVTVSAWITWDGGTGTLDPIISQLDNQDDGYCLYVNSSTNKPTFRLNNTEVESSNVLNVGWHNIVGTHNETTLSIFVDGENVGNTAKVGVGVEKFAFIGFDNSSDYFKGTIDEIAVWNRTLSVDEIARLYKLSYGISISNLTIKNSSIGVSLANCSEIYNCNLINHTIGIDVDNKTSIFIYNVSISECDVGIQINNSYPVIYDDCTELIVIGEYNITSSVGIYVNSSSNVGIYWSDFNCSDINLEFNDCNISTISVGNCTAINNTNPDIVNLSGPILGDPNNSYTYYSCINESDGEQWWYQFDWGDGNTTDWIGPNLGNVTVNASHSWEEEGGYYVRIIAKDVFFNKTEKILLFKTETLPPLINSVENTPDIVGFGSTITITVNATDDKRGNWSGIQYVKVNISIPSSPPEERNFTMINIGGDTYQYNFSDTWFIGQYNYSIFVVDNAYNTNESSGHSFNVSAQATINVATLQDTYGSSEYINITDPPTSPEDYYLTGRGLDYNKYYDAVSGKDVLEVYTGPVNYQDETDDWVPIDCDLDVLNPFSFPYWFGYRAGNNKGLYSVYFKENIQESWPVAFAYDKSVIPTMDVVRTKLMGVGYLDPSSDWSYEYLQSVQSSTGQINGNSATYEDVFTGTDVVWTYGNTGLKEEIIISNITRNLLQDNPPSDFGLSNDDSYLVFITRLDYQNLDMYDSSGMLTGNVTITEGGVDFKDALGEFKCALPLGEAYELNDPLNSQRLTYRIIQYNGNYYLLSGLKVTDLNEMTFPVIIDPTLSVKSSTSDGYIYKTSSTYNSAWASSTGSVMDTSTFIYLGQNRASGFPSGYTYYIYRSFLHFNTSELPSNAYIDNATLSIYKYADYSTTDFDITIQDGQPTYPHDPLQTGDYNKNYYDGNYGTLNTASYINGRNNITLTNYSCLTKEGMTKLCLRSSRDISGTSPTGYEYIGFYSREKVGVLNYNPMLVIEYRNQSKIVNTGSTNISGYLLIQVQFYNETLEDWVIDNDTINETAPRTINVSNQLALDYNLFNGMVSTDDLVNGDGTYRVYAAFCDPDGDVLICDDESLLEAWYEFEVDTS